MGETESVREVESLDHSEEEGGEVLGALILSIISGVVAHLILPALTALAIAYVMGYRRLMKSGKRKYNFNFLILITLSMGILSPVYFEFSNYQSGSLIYASIILVLIKVVFMSTRGFLIQRTVDPQLEATMSAAQSKSIIGVLTSVLNVQNLWILAILGLAIFPLILLDLTLGIFGLETPRLVLVFGVISLGTIAIVLDIKDRAVLAASSIRDTFTSNVDGGVNQDREEAVAFLNELEEELPELDVVDWTREDIQQLSPIQFFDIYGRCVERECENEGLEYRKFDSPEGFGDLYEIVFPDDELILAQVSCYRPNEAEASLGAIIEDVEHLLKEYNMEPHLVGVDVNFEVEQSTRIESLMRDGVLVCGIDELRRDFHDKNLKPSDVSSPY